MNSHEHYMQRALELAYFAEQSGEVPVGCVIVKNNEIIGEGFNQPILAHDPTAHAEIIALRAAAKQLHNYRLLDCTLYVTLEPCAMCLGAMFHARIAQLIFGADDPKAGAVKSVLKLSDEIKLNHHLIWQGGILNLECGNILKEFFKKRR